MIEIFIFVVAISILIQILKKKENKNKNKYTKRNQYMNKKDNNTYIKAEDIAKHFKISKKDLNEIFKLIKWAINSERKGIITTSKGIEQGSKVGTYMGVDYIHWDYKIKENKELIDAVEKFKYGKKESKTPKEKPMHTKVVNEEKNDLSKEQVKSKTTRMTNKEKKEKGDKYEVFISQHFREQGYTIAEHGKDNGVKDHGIDIIAKKGKEVLFVQCKNWSASSTNKVRDKELKVTMQDVKDYMEKYPIYEMGNYITKIMYIMSEDVLHGSAHHYIKEKSEEMEFRIIPMI